MRSEARTINRLTRGLNHLYVLQSLSTLTLEPHVYQGYNRYLLDKIITCLLANSPIHRIETKTPRPYENMMELAQTRLERNPQSQTVEKLLILKGGFAQDGLMAIPTLFPNFKSLEAEYRHPFLGYADSSRIISNVLHRLS